MGAAGAAEGERRQNARPRQRPATQLRSPHRSSRTSGRVEVAGTPPPSLFPAEPGIERCANAAISRSCTRMLSAMWGCTPTERSDASTADTSHSLTHSLTHSQRHQDANRRAVGVRREQHNDSNTSSGNTHPPPPPAKTTAQKPPTAAVYALEIRVASPDPDMLWTQSPRVSFSSRRSST